MKALTVALCIQTCAMLSMASCAKGPDESKQALALSRKERPVAVGLSTVTAVRFAESIQSTGTVKAIDDVMLSPEEGGILAAWMVERGARISRGMVIARLKDDLLKAGFEAAAAQYNIAELNYQKQQNVYAEQAVSELQFKSAGFSRDAAKAQADLMKARWDNTRIKSPIDGILDDRLLDAGEMAAPGVPLARLVNIDRVKISTSLPERHAGSVARGAEVKFTVVAYPERTFDGRISFVGSTLSADNKAFTVEAIIANRDHALKPEMVGRVSILRTARAGAILIPEGVVQQLDRNRLVVFVEGEGKAIERAVELGARSENLVEVLKGLSPGDRLITSGFTALVDGQAIVAAQ